jgi:hypothetical protein
MRVHKAVRRPLSPSDSMGDPAPLAHQSAPVRRPAASRSPLSSASLSPTAAALGSLPTDRLAALNQRHDRPGLLQLALHLGVLVAGALLWGQALGLAPLVPAPLVPAPLVPAPLVAPLGLFGLLLLGWGLAFAFCAMHEAGHRTAFASRSLNDSVAWWAGVLSFYNADFYRRYHQWHHRYTHLVGLSAGAQCHPLVDGQGPRPSGRAARRSQAAHLHPGRCGAGAVAIDLPPIRRLRPARPGLPAGRQWSAATGTGCRRWQWANRCCALCYWPFMAAAPASPTGCATPAPPIHWRRCAG